MLNLSANISLLYPELPFLDRVEAAARSGFKAIEVMYPYDYASASELAAALRDTGLVLSVLNAPPGDYAQGERGLACLAGNEQQYRHSIEQAVDYALQTNCSNIHVLTGNVPADQTANVTAQTLEESLCYAANYLAGAGLELLLEPLSTEVLPHYSMSTIEQAAQWQHVVVRSGCDNVSLQIDLYHTQMEQGNLWTLLQRYWSIISYVQIAGVPGRHEPTEGEINYEFLLQRLQAARFSGWVGCEYIPIGDTHAGLQWARDLQLLPA